MSKAEKILEIQNLHINYKARPSQVNAVNGLDLDIYAGETVGIVGETGAGKTTMALSIMGLLPEKTGRMTQGKILFKGENLASCGKKEMRKIRGSKISMVFQDPMTALDPIMPVGKQILESLKIHNHSKKPMKELHAEVDRLLTMVGIQPQRKADFPHQLSGGMRQRIVIAMALACNPEILIADEPTTALDVTIQAQVLAMMRDLKIQLNTAIILITHDLGVVANTCDKINVIYAGRIVEKGLVEEVFTSNKHHPYTAGLFGAIPNLEIDTDRLQPIEGAMPDPTNLPSGCHFHPRCKECMEICKEQEPPIISWGEHSIACHLYSEDRIHGNID